MAIGWRCLGNLVANVLPLLLAAAGASASASAPSSTVEADDYTRYELLAPDSAQFRILYEVTATSPGATAYFNPIRKGSEASREIVRDRASGKSLELAVVSGEEARRGGLPDAQLDMSYLRIRLPRPVPTGGGVRLLIEKTYKDPKSYYRRGGDRIVFARSLGIRRNAIVLPAGYELVSCNVPAQILTEPDGRIEVSFMHTGPDAASLLLEARLLPGADHPAAGGDAAPRARPGAPAVPPDAASAPLAPPAPVAPSVPATAAPPAAVLGRGAQERLAERLSERAHQDRTIVYFLRQPESHSFDLYHDYTEARAGADKYLNVVRKGSASSAPSARNLDTGEALRVETLRGEALRHAGLDAEELREVAGGSGGAPASVATVADIPPDTEVVIAHFEPVRPGESVRLRIAETYTDPRSYRLDGDLLVFDRTFGRPRNAVVLPAGWSLAASAIPATVTETADGRIRLDFVNPRPDDIAVLIEARRRPPG
ncbi:MAG TPA: hypothetical protein VOA80_05640 [Thermoanaerobaculia bacterium]|nr:hypothetical protein [Thermoanaerobaculia bacterium]